MSNQPPGQPTGSLEVTDLKPPKPSKGSRAGGLLERLSNAAKKLELPSIVVLAAVAYNTFQDVKRHETELGRLRDDLGSRTAELSATRARLDEQVASSSEITDQIVCHLHDQALKRFTDFCQESEGEIQAYPRLACKLRQLKKPVDFIPPFLTVPSNCSK